MCTQGSVFHCSGLDLNAFPARIPSPVPTLSLHGHFAPGRPSAHSRAWLSCTSARPTCFVEGISIGVAGRLLGRFCGVHAGIRFDPTPRQKTRMCVQKSSAPEKVPVVIPHMFPSPSSSLHPRRRFFLSEGLRVAAGFVSLLFPVQPPSLLLSARVSLPPSLPYPPLPPHPPLLSPPSLSLLHSRFIDLSCVFCGFQTETEPGKCCKCCSDSPVNSQIRASFLSVKWEYYYE